MGDKFFNRVVRSLGKVNFRTRFEFSHARFALGLPDDAQSTRLLKKFTLRGEDGCEYLVQVKCPVFVTGAADWAYFPAQGNATKIYDAIERLHPGKAKLWIAKGVGSGGLQRSRPFPWSMIRHSNGWTRCCSVQGSSMGSLTLRLVSHIVFPLSLL